MRLMLFRLPLIIILSACSYGRFKLDIASPVPRDEFTARRTQFLSQMAPGEVAILHSAPVLNRNDDVDFDYRQASDFYYLTGWIEPNSILLLRKLKSGASQTILYVQKHDPHVETWTGHRLGTEGALALGGIDTAFTMEEFDDARGKYLYGTHKLILSDGGDTEFKADLDKFLAKAGAYAPAAIQRAGTITAPMRLIKSPAEIEQIQRAVDITGASLREAFGKLTGLTYEWQLQAEIEYGFKKRGAERLGFPSIVGSGKNATVLHYETNRDVLDKSGLVVLDVGAEYHYYSADVTRTVPVDGTFSPEQKAIYELVLQANLAAIDKVKPGAKFRAPHNTAVKILTRGLVKLGLLTGEVDSLIAQRKYRKFFMHGTSHWLGLDVHDVGGYHQANGKPRILEPGMILTIEPGIYIKAGLEDVDPRWYNIGVRIEDDVLVTEDGHRVLTAGIPKTVRALEKGLR